MSSIELVHKLQPSSDGQFQIADTFALESGEALVNPVQRYTVYGSLNAKRDNAVLVCHALSGNADVATWWPHLFTESSALLDPDRDCVIGINIFGSCYGSTGPSSIDPSTGRQYGPTFPLIDVRDIVRAQSSLIESLGIRQLKLVIGASIGGMQALEWTILFPERVKQAVCIAMAPLNSMGLALNHLQRQAIMLDRRWAGGDYPPDQQPIDGLMLARALGVTTYKSVELFEKRFGRKPNRTGEDPWATSGLDHAGRFDVAGYLDYQGQRFYARFDANSYISITRTMDTFDPVRGYASSHGAYCRIHAHVIFIGISTDRLFPPNEVRSLAACLNNAGVQCDYRDMTSLHGHDAFLTEADRLAQLLIPLLM